MKLYYQVVLGSVKLESAITELMARYADTRAEKPPARGYAALAVVIVNRDGKPVEKPAVAISSFGWGVPCALRGGLVDLADWPSKETALIEKLDRSLRNFDKEGELLPLDAPVIHKAFDWLVDELGLAPDLVDPPRFAIRSYEYYKSPDPPEPLLLNSFFLGDLARASDLFERGQATPNLQRYLGVIAPENRRDLLADRPALMAAVAPKLFPSARWPGPGRHPLVLLQQAAVNLTFSELASEGILAVNGPPGTGKTTLLRDIVAAIVAARAEVMATFDDPAEAFEHSGLRIRAGQAWLHLYRINPKLRGFEVVVASSNNKAVENVSAELPGVASIAKDASGLRYFSTVSDALLGGKTWGLIAAVLGNAANRGRFKQTFWWDKDVGLSTYLAAAAGTPQFVETAPGAAATRPPRIVTAEQAPQDHHQALHRWNEARKAFAAAVQKSGMILEDLDSIRVLSESLPKLAKEEIAIRERAETQRIAAEREKADLIQAEMALASACSARDSAKESHRLHVIAKPGIFSRLFRTNAFRAWNQVDKLRTSTLLQAINTVTRKEEAVRQRKQLAQTATAEKDKAAADLANVIQRLESATRKIDAVRERIGAHFVDDEFFDRERGERHRLNPWLDDATQRIRDDVFITAIKLHKAFVDAAAKPLRHNLGALMRGFTGGAALGPGKEELFPHLWASLFLVVPAVSTTFASIQRMLGTLPPEELGWLLIDEAGQALPQAAVGALMRTRRAVIVGDPVQIEPVVVLPESLTETICKKFGVDPDHFNAPAASVQTLADAATPYMAEFAGQSGGSRTVGVPLLVHRRCANPMFGISNVVAYERLMVHAKKPGKSAIRDLFGPSRWFNVRGSAEEKWCPEEGVVVLDMLRQMAKGNISTLDLYIVTPFVVVQDHLRRLVAESNVIQRWTDNPWKWAHERIGTVHTVQGREADTVVFVLGAPAPHQTGARNWAGGRPNLLNVAVSRAKEALYVVGNRDLWRGAGLFRELDARLPK